MDEGTRITPEVEEFLRAARAKQVDKCAEMLKADEKLINSVEAGGYCALHFACSNGDVHMIEMLAQFKPNVELVNYDGNTPMMMAAKVKHHAAIKAMVDLGACVNFESKEGGRTAIHFAASMGNVETVRYLASLGAKTIHKNCESGTLLHWATHCGEVNVVGPIIYEFGVPVNEADAHGGTAIFNAIFMKKNAIVVFLLEHGANPNVMITRDNATPLHIAVEHGSLEDVKCLLSFGANTDAVNSEKDTPLSLALRLKKSTMLKEMLKTRPTSEKKLTDAARFKAHGNKVFADGENVKASKFYTQAIQLDPSNHVYFSNRAVCYFKLHLYPAALYDAERCIALAPKWAKGYFRKASTLHAMKNSTEALAVCVAGLKLEPTNNDLVTLKAAIVQK